LRAVIITDLFTLTQRCQYFLDDLSVFWGPCQYKSFAQRKGKGNNQMNTSLATDGYIVYISMESLAGFDTRAHHVVISTLK
jgi:hypothetical protein